MKTCLVTSVKIETLLIKGGFDGSVHVQATTLILQFDCL